MPEASLSPLPPEPTIPVVAPIPAPVMHSDHKFLILGGLVILALLAVGFLAFNLIKSPQNAGNTPAPAPTAVAPTPVATPTPTQTPPPPVPPAADRTEVDDVKGIITFTSEELGITFAVSKLDPQENVSITRKDNVVYVNPGFPNPEDGQWVEVFTKDEDVALVDAIKTRFLSGYDPAECFTTGPKAITYSAVPTTYVQAHISFPTDSSDDLSSMFEKASKCPPTYTATNGVTMFWGTTTPNTHYVFFSIGQYAILGPVEDTSWHDSFRFL